MAAKKTAGKVKKTVKTEVNAKAELSIPVYNLEGKEEKRLDLPAELFGVKQNPVLVAQYVRVYLANQRQGTASTKDRSQITASTRKIYRQKGTGNARHGSVKAPIFVGGGVVGGPKPTDYSLRMNKKQKRQALFSVLSQKAQDGGIISLTENALEMKPKTKDMVQLLKAIGVRGKKITLVLPEMKSKGLILSARNIPKVEIISVSTINPYTILNNEKTIFIENALTMLPTIFKKNAN